MFKIEDNTIYLTSGDKAQIPFGIEDYQFQIDDIVKLKVYNKNQLNQEPVLAKEVTVTEQTDTVYIPLKSEETKIGEMCNRKTTYWYEITLNEEETPLGFDEDGAKLFILLPEGKEETNG